MTIDWCQEHDSQYADEQDGHPYCWNWSLQQSESTDPANFDLTCRFVAMRLIPDNVEETIFQVLYNMPLPHPVDGSYEKPVREQARRVNVALDRTP